MSRSRRRRLRRAALLSLSLALLLPLRVHAQACRLQRVDSTEVLRWVDSLVPQTLQAPDSRVALRLVEIPSRGSCWTAVEATWLDGMGGALALLRPDHRLAFFGLYPYIANARPAGLDRVAFSYQRGHGTGYGLGTREDRFLVLCSFGTAHWAECLDLDLTVEINTAPERMAPDSSAGLYLTRRSDIRVLGDSVEVHWYLDWQLVFMNATLGQSHTTDLGVSRLRLP
jgi:hypothetical protein